MTNLMVARLLAYCVCYVPLLNKHFTADNIFA